MYAEKGNHIITAATEHKAILDTCKRLEKHGCRVTYLPVQANGLVDLDMLREAITDKTILVSIMYANNEIGVMQPMAEIGKIAKRSGVLFHTDGVQAVGKVPVNVIKDNIDLMSISAHKMYGPKGVGALYVRRKNPRVQLTAQMDGGGHERGMRSGTLNVPGIVGLGEACAICQRGDGGGIEAHGVSARQAARTSWRPSSTKSTSTARWSTGCRNNLNISFAYVEGESLLMGINDIAVSSGSACTSATLEPSYVLKALGAGDDLAHSSIRFGLGRFNTEEEVDYVAGRVIEVVRKLRELSPLYEMAKEGIDLSQGSVGGGLIRQDKSRGDNNGIFGQSSRSLQQPAQRRLARQERSQRRHRHGGRAGVRRRDEAAGEGEPGRPASSKTPSSRPSAAAARSPVRRWPPSGCKGKTVDEALAIKNTDIVNELSLPPVKIHCSVLAEDAIKAAIGDYKKKQWRKTEAVGSKRSHRNMTEQAPVSGNDSRSRPKRSQKIREAVRQARRAGRAASGRAGRRLLGLELSVQVRRQAAADRQGLRIRRT